MIQSKLQSEQLKTAEPSLKMDGETQSKEDSMIGARLLKSVRELQNEKEYGIREKRKIRISRAVASQWSQHFEEIMTTISATSGLHS